MILEHFLLKLHHWSALRVQSIPIGVKSILKKFIIFLSHEKCGQGAKCFDTEEKSVIRRELALSGPRWLPSLSLEHQHLSPLLLSSGQSENGRAGILRGRLKYFLSNCLAHPPCCSPTFGWRWRRKDKSSKRQSCVHVIMSVPPPLQKRARHQVKSTRSSVSQTDPLLI